MAARLLGQLLHLPASERAELALTLWESLDDADRVAHFHLSPELQAELDRRWGSHTAAPNTAIPWNEVQRRLRRDK
ncbi:MAG: addiction module protein [Terriglobales bacterium]